MRETNHKHSSEHIKSSFAVPERFFACEAAGLEWLRAAEDLGGAAVVRVRRVERQALVLEHIRETSPSARKAGEFGAALARTHSAGAAGWGAAPDGWEGDGYFGPLTQPEIMTLNSHDSFGIYWGQERIAPALRMLDGQFSTEQMRVFDRLLERLADGSLDDDTSVVRVHGDLWWGNLMWAEDSAVLIDPAAHGGHRGEDLGLLALFDTPYFAEIVAGYKSECADSGFLERLDLYQLYAVLMHAVFFGGSYGAQALRIAQRYV